jgi:hypothetical protein
MLACTEDELRRLLADTVFTRNLGFVLQKSMWGSALSTSRFRRRLRGRAGLSAGRFLWLRPMWRCGSPIKTRLGLADGSVTAEMKTNFLGGAKRESFQGSAKVLKCGRQLIYGTAECVSADGRLLAHHTVTYIRV